MPVTILYQGNPLTFPNLDSPDEAYKSLGVAPEAPVNPYTGQSAAKPAAPQVDASQLDARSEPDGIDPELLKNNKSWLAASRILYNATQGKDWDDKTGDSAKLAEWGLDRMARFNNNLPLMGVDAVQIKNAPDDQKKAFLYLLDTYEKTQWTAGGIARSAKWAALDPVNYVGLSSFGLGAAAGEAAKLTTIQGLKTALKTHGLTGAIEGGLFGFAHSRVEEEARKNAGGQEGIDYGHVALNAAAGAGMGAVLSPLINGLVGHFTPAKAAKGADPQPKIGGEAPDPVFQRNADAAEGAGNLGVPETASQHQLPGFSDIIGQHMDRLPIQRNLEQVPESSVPRLKPGAVPDHNAPWDYKLMGTFDQPDMFPNTPVERRLPASAADTIKLERDPAHLGRDFSDMLTPAQMQAADDAMIKATTTGENPIVALASGKAKTTFDNIPVPSTAEKIGGANGPTLTDLKQLLMDLGSKMDRDAIKGWRNLTDATSPLTRALVHLSAQDAKQLVSEFAASSMSQKQFTGFVNAAITAQNQVAHYIDTQLATRTATSNPAFKAEIEKKIDAAYRVFEPLKNIAKEAGSTSGRTLNFQNYNRFAAAQREIDLPSLLQKAGIDPATATNREKADTIERWFSNVIDRTEQRANDVKIQALRQEIADASPTADVKDLWDRLAQTREAIRLEERAQMSLGGKLFDSFNTVMGHIGHFMASTVLSPSSLTVNTISNAAMVFSRPALHFIAKPDHVAFRQMTAAYTAMARISGSAFKQARLAFDLEHSLLTGTESKWIENQLNPLEKIEGGNNIMKFLGRNGVRLWTRALNATDEFFQVVAYHGFVEGDAVAKALLSAKKQGLDSAATEALVKQAVKSKLDNAFTKTPDSSTVGMLRDAGIKKGYRGDNLKVYIQNELDNNKGLLRKATDEEGISYTNDLLFKREFSGDNALSSAAQMYEDFVQRFPLMRVMGQLFFRTPVRVFEAGMRMVPGVQLVTPKFLDDLAGSNGVAKQLRARGELMVGYGFTTSVMTGFATGTISGSGADLSVKERRKLEDAGWRPYSIKMGDTWFNYRNYDPISTPIKIIVNAMERLQHLQYREAQGEMVDKSSLEQVMGYLGIATASVLNSIKDANLTAGIDDWIKLGEGLADPERKDYAIKQFFTSKAQLAVPNAIRRSQRYFGDGQNVSNEPAGVDQIMESIINPASEKVTHQFDSLGFPRTIQQQGFFPFIGIDAAGREARQRGLGERDAKTLNEIAKLSYASGKTFNPDSKWGNIDLKSEKTGDGSTTLYNKVMSIYNQEMPKAAAEFFDDAKGLPMGRRGGLSPRGEAFSKLQTGIWRGAIASLAEKEPKLYQALENKMNAKADVFSGNREVGFSF